MAGIRIRSKEDFERWLNGIADEKQRRRVAIALASRATMRVLPTVEMWLRQNENASSTVLSILRAMAASQIAAVFVLLDKKFKTIVDDAHKAAQISWPGPSAHDVAYAASDAAYAILTTHGAHAVNAAARAAANAARAVADAARTYKISGIFGTIASADLPVWKSLEIDMYILGDMNDDRDLFYKPLWIHAPPKWVKYKWHLIKQFLLARKGEHWEVWTNWYDARLDPSRHIPCYSPPDMRLERQRVLLPEYLWEQGPAAVNAAIKELIEKHECSKKKEEKSPSKETTDITQETAIPDDLDDPEPQNDDALTFTFSGEGPIDVDERNGVDQLRHDAEARELHSETRRKAQALLGLSARNETGDNATSQLIEEVELFSDALGETTQDVKPALLVVRGDALRNMLAVQQERDDFADIPPLPERYLLALRNLVTAYNVYVTLDPELTRRDKARLGPDATRNMIAPDDGMRIIEDAVKENLATDKVKQVMAEEAANAPETPTPENRISRRFTESVRNFARAALARLWANKGKIAVGSAGAAVGLYKLANWVLRNEQWFLAVFKHNPSMHAWVMQFINWLKTLPLA